MPKIDYYLSVISPFCYLAGDRLERTAQKHGATIDYHPVDIVAVGNATGWTPPPKRHPARMEYRAQELARIAAREGLDINLKPAHWPCDQLPASRAINAALAAGADAGPLAQAFMHAVWAGEHDIADPATVAELLAEHSVAADVAESHATAAEERYHADTAAAPDAGVFGVPFYIVDDQRFWGQDRIMDLDRYLSNHD